jgi:subfamily B ATP-binding cassette protein HlyB/CyaB
VNRLKGKVTILFIAHQLPRGLQVDEVLTLNAEKATQMRVVDEVKG